MERKDRIDAFGAAVLLSVMLAMSLGHVLIKIINGGMDPVFQAGLRSAASRSVGHSPFLESMRVLDGIEMFEDDVTRNS